MYNSCITKINQRPDKFERIEFEDSIEYPDAEGDALLTDGVSFENSDVINYIKKIITEMPKKYSAILTLFYLEDMTHEEICDVLQIPLGTVKIHLHRGRALLRSRISGEFQSVRIPA
ncbi:MAG: RNA polymerase sigma factor [Bacteroidota bacterium]